MRAGIRPWIQSPALQTNKQKPKNAKQAEVTEIVGTAHPQSIRLSPGDEAPKTAEPYQSGLHINLWPGTDLA